jgi:hypothetical protein
MLAWFAPEQTQDRRLGDPDHSARTKPRCRQFTALDELS